MKTMKINYFKTKMMLKDMIQNKNFLQRENSYFFDFKRGEDIFKVLPDEFSLHNKRLLDIGAGIGTLSIVSAKMGAKTDAIESNENIIPLIKSLAEENGLKVNVITEDFLKFRPKKKYDFLICNDVLEHIEDKEKFVRKMSRILKKDGYSLVKIPNKYSLIENLMDSHFNLPLPIFSSTLTRLIVSRLYKDKRKNLYICSKSELKRLFIKNGFQVFDLTKKYFIQRNSYSAMLSQAPIRRYGLKLWGNLRRFAVLSNLLASQSTQILLLAKKK